jgi:hypothetical protein
VLSALYICAIPLCAEEKTSKSAELTATKKPVQVFILMGSGNVIEAAKVKNKKSPDALEDLIRDKGLYRFLIDEEGYWASRRDVRMVAVKSDQGKSQIYREGWLRMNRYQFGIEQGIGHQLGEALEAPVLLIKSAAGNRSLGWDLLPPGSKSYEMQLFDKKTDSLRTYVFPGYKQSPERWEMGSEPEAVTWYAGKQYDEDVAHVKMVLKDLNRYYPGHKDYEVAGFFWWQGGKDTRNEGHYRRYETNLTNFIQALRTDFEAPKAIFVAASLAETKEGATSPDGKILNAIKSVAAASDEKNSDAKVGFVYTHPFYTKGTAAGQYGGDPKLFMDVGIAMGKEMVELLDDKKDF